MKSVRGLWALALLVIAIGGIGIGWYVSDAGSKQAWIDSRIPPEADFKPLLEKELRNIAEQDLNLTGEITFTYEFLKDGPTPIDGAPRYFLWVIYRSGGAVVQQGATTVAGVNKLGFATYTFAPLDMIRSQPDVLKKHFPDAIADKIRARASEAR